MTTAQQAHQYNIDAAQRELDMRSAEGEDVSHLRVCQRTAAIVPAVAAVIEHDPNYTPPARDWTLDRALPTTPEQLRAALEAAYPPSATCWTEATEEVRDMSRGARTLLGLPESFAISFREIDTPAEWNTQGINSIVGWYASMQPEERTTFLKRIKGLY